MLGSMPHFPWHSAQHGLIFEGIVLGRVRAFGIARDYITPADDPIQFYAIVFAAFIALGFFSWISAGIFRMDREIKRKYR